MSTKSEEDQDHLQKVTGSEDQNETPLEKRTTENENLSSKKKQKAAVLPLRNIEGLDKEVIYIAGIDEAGRGPVLGPMVYAIAFYPSGEKDKFQQMGFNDSKKLTAEQREKLFEKLSLKNVGYITDILSPQSLSTDMLRVNQHNLNRISHECAIGLVSQVLAQGFQIKALYVDTVGVAEKYQTKLKAKFPKISKIVVTQKADSKYPIVGAASIAAKVMRDKILEKWEFQEKGLEISTEFGSGYPGDPGTLKWLKSNQDKIFGFPNVVRFSWKTTTKILEESCVPVLWSYEDSVVLDTLESSPRMSNTKKQAMEDQANRARQHKNSLKSLETRSKFFAARRMGRVISQL